MGGRDTRLAAALLALFGLISGSASGLASAAPFAYIPDGSGSTVSRMDLANNEALPIAVELHPIGVGSSADGSVVVVANQGSNSASVIDGAAGVVTWTVPVGSRPHGVGVTPDGRKAYVGNSDDSTVSVIDTATGVVTKTIALGGRPAAIAMSPDGHRAYVATTFDAGTLTVIDTTADLAVTDVVVSTESPTFGVAVDPTGSRVYVGLFAGLAVVDATTNLFLDDVPFGCPDACSQLEDVAVTPDGATVYAGLFGDGGVVAVDTTTLAWETLPTSSAFSSPFGVEVSPDGATLYVLNSATGTIDLFDTATRTVRATLVALVSFPAAVGDFIAGEGPAADPPLLDGAARACQKAVLDSFRPYGAKVYQLLSTCLQRVQKDEAAGSLRTATVAACSRDLDAANPSSRLSRARATTLQRILKRCASLAPAALGSPCDAAAPDAAALAECVLDAQLRGAGELVRREVTAACALLAEVGLDAALADTGICP